MRASTISCGPKLILAAAACFCLPATGRADVLPFAPRLDVGELAIEEDEKSTPPLPLRLEADDDSPTHRIVIPAMVLATLADVPLRARHSMSVSTTRSVAAGITLSAAVGFGFVAYRRGRATRIAAVMLIGAAVAGAGACVSPAWADIPPGRPWRILPVPQPREVVDVVTLRQGANVVLELAEADDQTIVIVVGKKAGPAK
jgi:hypothetical protein